MPQADDPRGARDDGRMPAQIINNTLRPHRNAPCSPRPSPPGSRLSKRPIQAPPPQKANRLDRFSSPSNSQSSPAVRRPTARALWRSKRKPRNRTNHGEKARRRKCSSGLIRPPDPMLVRGSRVRPSVAVLPNPKKPDISSRAIAAIGSARLTQPVSENSSRRQNRCLMRSPNSR